MDMAPKRQPTTIDLTHDSSPPPAKKPKSNPRSKIERQQKVEDSAIDLLSDSDLDSLPTALAKPNAKQKATSTKALAQFTIAENAIHASLPTSDTNNQLNVFTCRFSTIPKTTISIQGVEYPTYPTYSRDDLLPILIDNDDASPTSNPRAWIGPSWKANSCALDTFLWTLTILHIRTTRNDTPLSSASLNTTDPLSHLMTRYLRLPLTALTQAQVDSFRDSIYATVAANPGMHFTSAKGMDIVNLFSFALSRSIHLHTLSFTLARLKACKGCPGYGISHPQDIYTINTPATEEAKITPSQQLQEFFAARKVGANLARCPYCATESPTRKRVVLDRLPYLLLWMDGCHRIGKGIAQYSHLVELEVDVASETIIPLSSSARGEGKEGEVRLWRPRRLRVVYKPVVLIVRDLNKMHWYAGSCFGMGKPGWLVYDGLADGQVVKRVKGQGFINGLVKEEGNEVRVVVLEKVEEEEMA